MTTMNTRNDKQKPIFKERLRLPSIFNKNGNANSTPSPVESSDAELSERTSRSSRKDSLAEEISRKPSNGDHETNKKDSRGSKSKLRAASVVSLTSQDDEMDLRHILSPSATVLPEYQELLGSMNAPEETFEPLVETADTVEVMMEKIEMSLRQDFSLRNVQLHIETLLLSLLQANVIRKSLSSRLEDKVKEIQDIRNNMKRDARVGKVLKLAEHWRKERNAMEAEQNQSKHQLKIMETEYEMLDKKAQKMKAAMEKQKDNAKMIQRCVSQKERLEEKLMVSENIIKELKDKNTELQEQYNELEANTQEEIDNLKEQLNLNPRRKTADLRSLYEQVSDLKSFKEARQKQIEELNSTINILRKNNEKKMHIITSLDETVKAYKTTIDKQEKQIRGLLFNNARLDKLASEQKSELNEMPEALDVVRREKDALLKAVEANERKELIMKNDIKQKELKHFQSVNTIASLQQKQKELQDDIVVHRKIEIGLQEELRDKRLDVNRAKDVLVNCQKSLGVTESKLAKCSRESESARLHIVRLTKEMEHTQKESNDFLQALRECDRYRFQDSEFIEYMKTTIFQLNHHVEERKNAYRTIVTENDKFRNLLTRMEKSLTEARHSQITGTAVKREMAEEMVLLKGMLKFCEGECASAYISRDQVIDQVVIMKKKDLSRVYEMTKQINELSEKRYKIEQLMQMTRNLKYEVLVMSERLDKAQRQLIFKDIQIIETQKQRDLFGHMIIRNKTEMSLLKEKIRFMSESMDLNAKDYNARLSDIKLLVIEIKNLKYKLANSLKRNENVNDLKQDYNVCNRELQLERAKRGFDRNEVPIRPHFNRHIKDASPSKYKEIMKMQMMQRLVIKKSSQITQKEAKIFELEKSLCQLKIMLLRRPPIELAKKCNLQTHIIRRKNRYTKMLMADTNTLTHDLQVAGAENKRLRESLVKCRSELQKYKQKSVKKCPQCNSQHQSRGINSS